MSDNNASGETPPPPPGPPGNPPSPPLSHRHYVSIMNAIRGLENARVAPTPHFLSTISRLDINTTSGSAYGLHVNVRPQIPDPSGQEGHASQSSPGGRGVANAGQSVLGVTGVGGVDEGAPGNASGSRGYTGGTSAVPETGDVRGNHSIRDGDMQDESHNRNPQPPPPSTEPPQMNTTTTSAAHPGPVFPRDEDNNRNARPLPSTDPHGTSSRRRRRATPTPLVNQSRSEHNAEVDAQANKRKLANAVSSGTTEIVRSIVPKVEGKRAAPASGPSTKEKKQKTNADRSMGPPPPPPSREPSPSKDQKLEPKGRARSEATAAATASNASSTGRQNRAQSEASAPVPAKGATTGTSSGQRTLARPSRCRNNGPSEATKSPAPSAKKYVPVAERWDYDNRNPTTPDKPESDPEAPIKQRNKERRERKKAEADAAKRAASADDAESSSERPAKKTKHEDQDGNSVIDQPFQANEKAPRLRSRTAQQPEDDDPDDDDDEDDADGHNGSDGDNDGDSDDGDGRMSQEEKRVKRQRGEMKVFIVTDLSDRGGEHVTYDDLLTKLERNEQGNEVPKIFAGRSRAS